MIYNRSGGDKQIKRKSAHKMQQVKKIQKGNNAPSKFKKWKYQMEILTSGNKSWNNQVALDK